MKSHLPSNLLTIYGRKPVLEALQDDRIQFYKVHLADSNQHSAIIRDIESLCEKRGIVIEIHDRLALSRISKNKKQDQGVAADIICEHFVSLDEFLTKLDTHPCRLIGLENVTNPQNLGMIIRSVTASPTNALLLPRKGCAKLDALVIKASAGTLFKAPIILCDDLPSALKQLQEASFIINALALSDSHSIHTYQQQSREVFLLGNETEGLSRKVLGACNNNLHFPMQRGVESLNVAVTAALVAFLPNK